MNRPGILTGVSGLVRALSTNPGIRNAIRRRVLNVKGATSRLLGSSANAADVQAYEQWTRENQCSGDLYTAGRFWARLNRQHANAIRGGGLESLRNEYFNRTFSGPEPESRQVYRALLFLYYKHVQQIDTDGFLASHEDPAIGGTGDQEVLFGRAVSLDFLQSVEEAYAIRAAWQCVGRAGAPRVIVELGAGYGRLAYVCRKMMPECSYVILDLPEALVCARSWLSRVLGEPLVDSRQMDSTQPLTRQALEAGKVFLLLPHRIEQIAADAADAFVNIYSFAEMPREAIANYFIHLDRITNGVFFTKQRALEENVFDGIQVSESSYPVRPHWRQLSRSTSTLYDRFFEAAYATRDS